MMRINLNDIQNFQRCPALAKFLLYQNKSSWLSTNYFLADHPLPHIVKLAYMRRFLKGKDLSWESIRGIICREELSQPKREGLLLRAAAWHKIFLEDDREGIADLDVTAQYDDVVFSDRFPLILLSSRTQSGAIVTLSSSRSYFQDELVFKIAFWAVARYLENTKWSKVTIDFSSPDCKVAGVDTILRPALAENLLNSFSTLVRQDAAYPARTTLCSPECSFVQQCIDKWS
jgi:hypothetical protein